MSKPILYIAGKDPLEELGGGHSSYVRAHARAALRLGFEPHLFCISRESGVRETEYGAVHRLRSPIRHRAGGAHSVRVATAIWHMPLLAAGLARFFSANPAAQRIHGFGVWGSAGVAVGRRLRRVGRRLAIVSSAYTLLSHEHRGKLHGLNQVHGAVERLRAASEALWIRLAVTRHERRAYCGADIVLINHESVRRLLRAECGPVLRVRSIPFTSERALLAAPAPLDPPDALATLRPADAPLIVAVSRHDSRKGVDVLLRALAELRRAGVRYRACLVGGGRLLEAHRRLAGDLGLAETTAVTGFVDSASAYLDRADLFVLPSLEEGGGSLALIEAMQAGLPIVASKVDGIPEDVVDGESALLVEPGDPVALSRSMQRALADAALRKRLGGCAHATFAARFSGAAFTRALGEVYAELDVLP